MPADVINLSLSTTATGCKSRASVMSTTNLEEAATVAAEYIASLDNLPNETQFLLAEIKHRDARTNELQAEIAKESVRYIRHSVKSASSAPGQALSPKDSAIPPSIAAHYAEIDRLAEEKERLAQRMAQLVMRARARLEHDLGKVLVLQGEADPAAQAAALTASALKSSMQSITDGVRNPIAIPEAPMQASPSAAAQPPQKKRRVTAASSAGSIKLPSPAPMAASAYGGAQRSRLSQQVHTRHSPMRTRRPTVSLDADEDAEGEEDVDTGDDGGDVEDKELYCFCQKLSYGEMIACDNPHCRYQWFHLPCVNVKPPLPDSWYCSECAPAMKGAQAAGGTRKGRKK